MGAHARRTRRRTTRDAPPVTRAAPAGGAPRTTGPRSFPGDFVESWRRQAWPARILRAFLGVTFAYAGAQKLADPGFLQRGSPTYIGTQLAGFARGSPIGGLLHVMGRVPVEVGLGIAFAELAIGLGTLVGVAPVTAAVGGAVVSLALLLSASWHVHPYFLGSDSIYAVAWIAFALMAFEDTRRSRRERPVRRSGYDPARRDLLRGGIVAAATLFAGGAAAAASRFRRAPASGDGLLRGTGPPPTGVAGPTGVTGTTHAPTGTPATTVPGSGGTGPSPPPNPAPPGRAIARLADLPVGEAMGFTGPNGVPAVLVRLGQHRVAAFSRICTHAGCEVGFDPSARLLVCPCHGAEFDPSRRAMPVAGPAPTALQPIHVVVDRGRGTIVLAAD